MKVKVITKFKDKYTHCFHEVNEILNVNELRYNEIAKFVKVIEDEIKTDNTRKVSSKKKNKSILADL